MNYALYVVIALAVAGIIIANNAMAASLTQQSVVVSKNTDKNTVVSQSSSQSSSSSIVSSNSSISTRMTSSSGSLSIDRELSGKIASSRINLTSGDIEAVLFGDWNLDSTGFTANFTQTPVNDTDVVEYEMNGLQLHAVQKIDDSIVMAGTIDIASNSTATVQDAPVTIIIQSGILVVGFDRETDANDLLGGIPIIGFEQ
jgi:hypothetical protein